jgi:hypothetical protein
MVISRMKVAQSPAASLTSPQRSSAFRSAPGSCLLIPVPLSFHTLTNTPSRNSHLFILLQKAGASLGTSTRGNCPKSIKISTYENLPGRSRCQVTPLESISNLLSPLKLTLTRKALNCPNLQQIKPLESGANLLSPLELTLTKNAPVTPLESTLTKYKDLKSHRIKLLQKRWGQGSRDAGFPFWEAPPESLRLRPYAILGLHRNESESHDRTRP